MFRYRSSLECEGLVGEESSACLRVEDNMPLEPLYDVRRSNMRRPGELRKATPLGVGLSNPSNVESRSAPRG